MENPKEEKNKKQKKPSEMMQHYLAIKEKYKDCLVFYRLGDFYEMFYDDAIKASQILDLTLTARDSGLEERAPMCGVPYHAVDTYIAKLVERGEKVAICEQLSDPKAGGGLVERDVVRIVSAGTLVEDTLLDETKNNYIACVSKTEESIAVAWADITTGEFFVTEFKGEGEKQLTEAVSLLLRYSVAEVICNDDMALLSKNIKEIKHGALPPFSCYVPWAFNVKHAEKTLLTQFNAATLAPYGIAGKENCISAAGALLEYLNETQKRSLANVSSIELYDRSEFLTIDSIAVRNLELVKNNAEGKKYGSLLWVIDQTKTAMGARLMRQWLLSPLKSAEKINARLNGVEELFNASVLRVGLQETLGEVKDVGRLTGKISYGNATPKDLEALKKSLEMLPSLRFRLSGFTSPILTGLLKDLPDVDDLAALLSAAIAENAPALTKDGGYIRAGYDSDLDELRGMREHAASLLKDMETREKERTDIRTLKIGFNRVFGYYIEVSNSFKDKVPQEYIRKQTLTNGERYITEELKQLEEKILTSEERALAFQDAAELAHDDQRGSLAPEHGFGLVVHLLERIIRRDRAGHSAEVRLVRRLDELAGNDRKLPALKKRREFVESAELAAALPHAFHELGRVLVDSGVVVGVVYDGYVAVSETVGEEFRLVSGFIEGTLEVCVVVLADDAL